MASRASQYRLDIQGLRAVAVGAIVIFHAFPTLLPGGFVGVDIFFVISGFLITGIIYRDILADRFSIAEFYRKRVRRIFPALFVMLLVVLAVGYLVLSPEAFAELGRNTVSSVFFVSNFDFWKSSGYFDRAAELRPLLHTWSLAVEEQFYIVFPVLLVVLMRFARALVLPVLGLVILVSLAASEWSVQQSEAGTGGYFLTPFRVYELLLGSVAAIAPVWSGFNQMRARTVAVALGLAMIVASVVLLAPDVPFPGLTALLPTVGVALVLYAGRAGESPPARLLTSAPFLFIGAISYSLYLWHWPVYAYLRVLSEPAHPDVIAVLIASALAIGLATLSYRFVEKPFAHRDTTAMPFLTLGGLGMVAIALVAGFVWQGGGMPQRFAPATLQMFAGADDISPERRRCHRRPAQDMPYDETCVLGVEGATADLVVWGDSHGVELAYAMSEALASENRAVRQVTGSACPPVVNVTFPRRPSCENANVAALLDIVADPVVDQVVLVLNAEGYFNSGMDFEEVRAGLAQAVSALHDAEKEVLLIGQIPNPQMDVPAIAGRNAHRGRDPSEIGVPRAKIDQIASRWNAALQDMAQQEGVAFFDATPVLCGPDLCPISRNGEVLYFNHAHISLTAARDVIEVLIP